MKGILMEVPTKEDKFGRNLYTKNVTTAANAIISTLKLKLVFCWRKV